ncbi:MAG: FAD:protein FMN transferase [Planctomycetes bacterium]|nr:FAD:protein FMN transferase [Planctomycetota bacterium]
MAELEPIGESGPAGGSSSGRGPERRFVGINRLMLLSFAAMAIGYILAGRLGWLWRDSSPATREFETMRTYARVVVPEAPGSALSPKELAALAEKDIREINDLMGPVGEFSDVRRLNQTPAGIWVEVNPLTWNVVMEALRWHRLSGGAFDPTIGPIKRLFKFDTSETGDWPTEEELAQAREKSGADKLLFEREGMRLAWKVDGMLLDLGAIAKGYAADRAAETLLANGVRNALIDVGGELRLIGRKPENTPVPWRAGVRDPRDGDVFETLELSDAAVATSGDYENYFIYQGRRYFHIIDPRTGLPLAEGAAGVTVVHPGSCLAADALATTMCVLGPEAGESFIRGQALGLFSQGVRAIMLLRESGGGLRRKEIVVEKGGKVKIFDDAIAGKDGG